MPSIPSGISMFSAVTGLLRVVYGHFKDTKAPYWQILFFSISPLIRFPTTFWSRISPMSSTSSLTSSSIFLIFYTSSSTISLWTSIVCLRDIYFLLLASKHYCQNFHRSQQCSHMLENQDRGTNFCPLVKNTVDRNPFAVVSKVNSSTINLCQQLDIFE